MRPPRTDRRGNGEWYDSLHEKPNARPLPPPLPPRARSASASAFGKVETEIVCIALRNPEARCAVETALGAAKFVHRGPESLGAASVVIVDGSDDVTAQVASLRAVTRPDAALVMLVDAREDATGDLVGSACRAGALACLRVPFVAAELVSLVSATLESHAAKAMVESLSRKLDLESHLASIGRMSAGITHEIGNPLNVALSNMEYVRLECDRLVEVLQNVIAAPSAMREQRLAEAKRALVRVTAEDGMKAAFAEAEEAHARLRALLGTMQGFVGAPGKTPREAVDLLAVAQEATRWLAGQLEGIEVETVGQPIVGLGDPALVAQIVQNLTTNASHASRLLATPRIRIHAYAADGRAVISVRDNGPGIPPELQERVFDPFYTTRRGEGGTGLGLALCREYALRMAAELGLWSVPGRGTCFRLSLPLFART